MLEQLKQQHRLVVRAQLEPIVGTTFQPTGFPDLGAAVFERPRRDANGNSTRGTERALLVESVQSLTNHFEQLGWDGRTNRPVGSISQLPYLEVVQDSSGTFLTSSRLEPHRLASAYVKDSMIDGSKVGSWLGDQLGLVRDQPLDWKRIYKAIFELDPLCLLHGVFFSDKQWHGNPKVRRALSAVIEAGDVQPVVSGGVKRDDVSFKSVEGRGAEEGYGFVLFGRTDYTAAEITLIASIDLAQIRGYGLDQDATDLLTTIGMWELSSLLHQPLRLRTACDLDVTRIDVLRPDGLNSLPEPKDLAEQIVASSVKFEVRGARTVTFAGKTKAKKSKS